MPSNAKLEVSRRSLFLAAGAALLTSGLSSKPALAEDAAVNMDQLVKETMGDGAVKMEKVTLDTPDKAENGALVRVPVKVDHPMAADNYIQSLAIFVDNNPKPLAAKFDFTPEMGAIQFEIRIKMAKPSKIRVIAKSNKGILYGAAKQVEVAEGGCAG
ncbi:MAG: thiosulfate oxidation carrier protein SoxY [Magnetococcales bacterium]|nr:thiosulfate oxidation carrier protein SoxY [Magnetococcales bacterium]NGZ25968.1 thiosulfate oxidation carrier protein SoxY [Magnetococcales bacterium]